MGLPFYTRVYFRESTLILHALSVSVKLEQGASAPVRCGALSAVRVQRALRELERSIAECAEQALVDEYGDADGELEAPVVDPKHDGPCCPPSPSLRVPGCIVSLRSMDNTIRRQTGLEVGECFEQTPYRI